jgi:hypothetical protein
MTVATLKDLIADLSNVAPPSQRMVYKGQVNYYARDLIIWCGVFRNLLLMSSKCALQVLKDPNTADSYSMADGDIIHIVTVSAPAGQAAPAPAPAFASAPAPAPAPAPFASPHPSTAHSSDPFAALLGGFPSAASNADANPFAAMMGGMGGMGGMEMPDMASMQAMLQQNPEYEICLCHREIL